MQNVVFLPATSADLPAVRALLKRCELPTEDVAPAPSATFLQARAGDTIVGTVGLEIFGENALLRSLAVAPERRGQMLGRELWVRIRDEARRRQVRRLYLLTTTAESWFARLGFARVGRDAVPDAIRGTTEFSALCPGTAAVMAIDLAGADQRVL
jgi:amino-acid N-acetyltransferase